MSKQAKKAPEKSLKKEAIPQLFLILGLFGGAILTEAMNLLHEMAKDVGGGFYWAWRILIIFVALPWFMLTMVRIIDYLYGKK